MPSNDTYIFEDLEAGGSLNTVIPNPSVTEVEVPILPGVAVAASTLHSDLTGRSSANQHPISAITGLQAALDAADEVVEVTLLVAEADLSGGAFTTLDLIGVADDVPRATLVGATVAAVSGDDVGTAWTVTSSGPCTAGDTIGVGRLVTAFGSGLSAVAQSSDGSTVEALVPVASRAELDALASSTTSALASKASASTVAAHAAALSNLANAAQSPFAAWLHNGATNDDGVTEWLDPIEYTGLTGAEGSAYEGIAVHRPAAATISGATPPADFTGVIYLTGQDTADHDGAHELFHTLESIGYVQADVEPGGVLFEDYGITDLDIGLYTTQTQTWNWGWIDPTDPRIVDDVEPIGLEVLQAGSLFRVGGGDNAGLWSTTVDGIHGPAIPLAEWSPVTVDGATSTVSEVLNDHEDRITAVEGGTVWAKAFGAGSAINTSTAEDTVASVTGPTVATGDFFEFRYAWRYLNNSGSSTNITVKIKVGSTVLTLTSAGNVGSGSVSRVVMVTGNIRVTGASTGAIEGTLTMTGSASSGAAVAGTQAIAETISGATLAATATLSTSHASHEMQFIHGMIQHHPA